MTLAGQFALPRAVDGALSFPVERSGPSKPQQLPERSTTQGGTVKRSTATDLMRVAGYHGDTRTFARLLVEQSVSRFTSLEAWRSGERAKAAGVKCTCIVCNEHVNNRG